MPDRSAAPPEVRILGSADAAVSLLLDEIRRAVAGRRGFVGLATGGTYTSLLRALGVELAAARIDPGCLVTHLDEYLGFRPEHRGGMVHELVRECPPLLAKLRDGTFASVPHDGSPAGLAAHEARLAAGGGVHLQLLGIGRNGHLAFNEPGTPFDEGFHVTRLAETTREDARARFAPDEPPREAVTSGLATILAAQRLVLCAFGSTKAAAVHTMLRGEIGPSCPATLVRRHGNALVLLDEPAAAGLRDRAGVADTRRPSR